MPNLFEQTKDLRFIGERLSGDPEVLHEVQDWAGIPASREQIKKILEMVPDIFPETWESPDSYEGLTEGQKKAYREIAQIGLMRLMGPSIQKIIEIGIYYRNNNSEK